MARIIVIDDDPWVRMMLRHVLEGSGHSVREALDGRTGTMMMREQCADLVITDINMPGQDGWETIVALLRDFPHVRIIAISGGSESETRFSLSLAERLRAHRVFTKPVDNSTLLTAVSQLLNGQQCP